MADGDDTPPPEPSAAHKAGVALKQRIVALAEAVDLLPQHIFTHTANYKPHTPVPYVSTDRTLHIIAEVEDNLRKHGALDTAYATGEWEAIKAEWLAIIPENKAPNWRKDAAARNKPDKIMR